MFVGHQYKRVSQQGDSDSDTTDNETAFFTSENGSRKWIMGTRLGNLNQDQELDLPYVHPTLPVEMKRNKSKGYYTRRQVVSGTCLLFVILAMVTAFAVVIILGQKYIEASPTNDNDLQSTTHMPAPTPLVANFIPIDNKLLIRPESTHSTSITMATSSPIAKPISITTCTTSTIKTTSSAHPPAVKTAAAERTDYKVASNERELSSPSSSQLETVTTEYLYQERGE